MDEDIELIDETFDVIDYDDGYDVDDDGNEFYYYAISIKGNLKDDIDDLMKKCDEVISKCKLFTDYDFHLDRGIYFGKLANKGEIEIRFTFEDDGL